ncbi:MAG: AAA family ATPase [Bacteroidetes bacterium]|nr:AAA family ATPase [Bacteroidota bacterium]
MNINLNSTIEAITKIKSTSNFKKYIDFIRFPFYRNLEFDSLINFDFPLTVFIGQNGCGKSSCLHALYGAPENYTPFTFWFDTKVDPIEYYDDQKKRHSFWYSFIDDNGKERQVIKARIKRKEDPNYWETSRPLVWAGMQKRAGKNDRDKPIEKKVIYIDFRSELSAFDKYYYYGDTDKLSSRNKQEFIRRKSTSLNKVLSQTVKRIDNRAGAVHKPLRLLSIEELKWISYILGKEYLEGKYLEHKFYRNDGYSVFFKTVHAKYSEAFAGSGEVAVVRLVLLVLDSEDYSLILLDEPEVSLHPGAQSRLKHFLLEQIKLRKHQIVICTHSPSLVKDLPKESIKVFIQNPKNGRFIIKENLTPEEAFYHIELPLDNKKNIIVEDILAKEIVQAVLKRMGEESLNLFNIKFNPGGESVLKKEFIPVYCRDNNRHDFVIFDGDQKIIDIHYDWQTFSVNNLNINFIASKIKEQTNEDIKFSVDGGRNGGDKEQLLQLMKNYLDYYLHNVFYFPRRTPEEIIWDDTKAQQILSISNDSSEFNSINEATCNKDKFALLALKLYDDSNAESINNLHKMFIKYWVSTSNQDYQQIENVLKKIISIS